MSKVHRRRRQKDPLDEVCMDAGEELTSLRGQQQPFLLHLET